jgi:hypothetical protein
MPLHLALVDILLKFQVQLHQLTPNAIAPLSKYFWVVASFEGIPSANGFEKNMNYIISRKRWRLMGLFWRHNLDALISTQNGTKAAE